MIRDYFDDLREIALSAHALRTATRTPDVLALLDDLAERVDRLREDRGLEPLRATTSGDLIALAAAAQAAVDSDCLPPEVNARLTEAVDRIASPPSPRPSAPGPWHVHTIGRDPYIFASDNTAVAVCCADAECRRQPGNEALICAAPDLRETLRAIAETYSVLLSPIDRDRALSVLRLANGGGA